MTAEAFAGSLLHNYLVTRRIVFWKLDTGTEPSCITIILKICSVQYDDNSCMLLEVDLLP